LESQPHLLSFFEHLYLTLYVHLFLATAHHPTPTGLSASFNYTQDTAPVPPWASSMTEQLQAMSGRLLQHEGAMQEQLKRLGDRVGFLETSMQVVLTLMSREEAARAASGMADKPAAAAAASPSAQNRELDPKQIENDSKPQWNKSVIVEKPPTPTIVQKQRSAPPPAPKEPKKKKFPFGYCVIHDSSELMPRVDQQRCLKWISGGGLLDLANELRALNPTISARAHSNLNCVVTNWVPTAFPQGSARRCVFSFALTDINFKVAKWLIFRIRTPEDL
jgi:hypothetical protein